MLIVVAFIITECQERNLLQNTLDKKGHFGGMVVELTIKDNTFHNQDTFTTLTLFLLLIVVYLIKLNFRLY